MVIPCQPDLTLNQELHQNLLTQHEQNLKQLTKMRLYYITFDLIDKELEDHSNSEKFLFTNGYTHSLIKLSTEACDTPRLHYTKCSQKEG